MAVSLILCVVCLPVCEMAVWRDHPQSRPFFLFLVNRLTNYLSASVIFHCICCVIAMTGLDFLYRSILSLSCSTLCSTNTHALMLLSLSLSLALSLSLSLSLSHTHTHTPPPSPSQKLLVDHSHYLSQLLWVSANALWAGGEIFAPTRDTPYPLFDG